MVISGFAGDRDSLFDLPPHPSPLPQGARGKGSRFVRFSNLAFNSVFQVGVICMNTSVSPLSPKGEGERESICALFKSCVQLGISSRRYLHKHLGQSPLPQGRGGKGADLWAFQILRSTRYFKSALLAQTPRSVPSPPRARGKGSRFVRFSNLAFNSVFQVGVTCTNTSVSPLSLWERARVRASSPG
jgi:hypothetical protein